MKITDLAILIFVSFASINSFSQPRDTIFFNRNWELTESKNYKYIRTYEITDTLFQITDYYKKGNLYMAGFCGLNADITHQELLFKSGPCYWYDKKGRLIKMALCNPAKYPQILNKITSSDSIQFEVEEKLNLDFWIFYFKNGNIASLGYKFDSCQNHGKWAFYYKNGAFKGLNTYNFGKLDGYSSWFSKKGYKILDEYYKNGKNHGTVKWYSHDTENEVIQTIQFENGKKIKRK